MASSCFHCSGTGQYTPRDLPRPSNRYREGSRCCELVALSITAIPVCFLALMVVVEVQSAFSNRDFLTVDDATAYVMHSTGNPFRLSYLVAGCGVAALATMVAFAFGFCCALFSKGKKIQLLNIIFLGIVAVLTVLQILLAVLLLVGLWTYVPALDEHIEDMCRQERDHHCSLERPPTFVAHVCGVMSDLVSFCSEPCGFVSQMCEGGFDRGLKVVDYVFGVALMSGLSSSLACCCLGCFVSELVTGKSVVDTCDCCGCMDRYDRSHQYKPI
ncbi:unnamed protein product [Prorocentrum cordatum]|uniref:Tetraspanin n=1 Tax=Prorocentrum cordatum TaxID=2364126 RepID=A0ABN9S557_9DINO|nr:unnamed protein product [Polarella glacialis]